MEGLGGTCWLRVLQLHPPQILSPWEINPGRICHIPMVFLLNIKYLQSCSKNRVFSDLLAQGKKIIHFWSLLCCQYFVCTWQKAPSFIECLLFLFMLGIKRGRQRVFSSHLEKSTKNSTGLGYYFKPKSLISIGFPRIQKLSWKP